jgi:hypothetical protein
MNGNSSNYKRTPIDQLMDLDAPDAMEPSEPKYDPKFQKYLRGDVKSQFMQGANGGVEHFLPPPPPQHAPHHAPPQHYAPAPKYPSGGVSYIDDDFNVMAEHFTPQKQQAPVMRATTDTTSLNCQDFFNHVQGCPICSKFYNTDKTIYIVIIVMLSLVSLILLKRVLEK